MKRLTVALGAGVLVIAACGQDAGRPLGPAAAPTPKVAGTFEVGRLHDLVAGTDALWGAGYEQGTVVRFDPVTNSVTGEIPVAEVLGSGPTELHPAGAALWLIAADSGAIGYLDPATKKVQRAGEAGPAGILDTAMSPTRMWLAQHSGERTAQEQTFRGVEIVSANGTLPPPGEEFSVYSDIAAGDAGVWAIDESQGTLSALAPPAGEPRVVTTGSEAFTGASATVHVAHGRVWVATSDEATTGVARFDPGTEETVGTILDGQDGVFASSPDALWVLTHDEDQGMLWRLDPEQPQSAGEPLRLDGEFSAAEIAFGFGSIWITHDTNLLTRVDVTGAEPVGPVPSPEPRGDAAVCDQAGPWSYCPEARWLRRVLLEAGLKVTGDTGTALEAETSGHPLHAWNTDAARPVAEVAASEGYEPVEGTEAYTDGERLLWEAQGLHLYVSSRTERPITDLPRAIVATLIDASRSVPMSADYEGAAPQPQPTGEPRVEQLDDGRVRVWPVTEDVPNSGTYLFTAPHCGLDWMIDFDASFWRALKPADYGNGDNYPFFYNSDEGTITFRNDDTAVYQASTGERITLERIDGPTVIDPCA